MLNGRDRTPPADPADIRLTYNTDHYVDGDGSVLKWSVVAEAMDHEGNDVVSRVGDLEIVVVDLGEIDDPTAVLDDDEADLGKIAGVIFDPDTGDLHSDLLDELAGLGDRVLIVNRVTLDPAWRGFGIGAYLTGVVVKRLAGGCQLAACYPAPLGPDQPAHHDPAWQTAADRLAAVWSTLGFVPFRDGVSVLDLGLRSLDEGLGQARARALSGGAAHAPGIGQAAGGNATVVITPRSPA